MKALFLVVTAGTASNATTGFLLAATRTPVASLKSQPSKGDDLGALLRDICAARYPARVVVGDAKEADIVRRRRPCERIDVVIYQHGRSLTDVKLRYFKVGAIMSQLPIYPGGTLCIDNDVALRRSAVDALFALFDTVRKNKKVVGLNHAHICSPKQHQLHNVPNKFCERNSGVIFWAEPTKSVVIAKEWLHELEHGTSKDGHDQMPLRKVLYRHRNDVYDLPARVQRRGLSHSPCEGEPLLWHAHRSDRIKWAKIHKHGAAEVCGFVV